MRYLLDVLLLLLLVFEMSFLYMPPFFHELVGVALLIPIFVHLFQNRFYLKALMKGRWPLPRMLGAAVNLLLLMTCLTSIISGCLISNALFADVMPLSLRSNPVPFFAAQCVGTRVSCDGGIAFWPARWQLVAETAACGQHHEPSFPREGLDGHNGPTAWRGRHLCGHAG